MNILHMSLWAHVFMFLQHRYLEVGVLGHKEISNICKLQINTLLLLILFNSNWQGVINQGQGDGNDWPPLPRLQAIKGSIVENLKTMIKLTKS